MFIIDRSNRHEFPEILETMYRQRYDAYVKGRGWKALERGDNRDCDQFDDEHAVYLVKVNESGHVLAHVRMLPTARPGILSSLFPHLCTSRDIPSDQRIYEITRFCIDPALNRKPEAKRIMDEIRIAMMEFGVIKNLKGLSWVADTFFVPFMHEMGWPVEPLGLPQPYDEGVAIAGYTEVSMDTLAHIRSFLEFPPVPVLSYLKNAEQLPQAA